MRWLNAVCGFVFGIVVSALPAEAHVGGGIAVGPDGNIYCVHTKKSQVLRISPRGEVTILASGVIGEGDDQRVHFHYPHDLAMDQVGNVYVADDSGGGLWRITPEGAASYSWPPKNPWQTLKVGVLGDPFALDAENNIYLVNHPTTEGPDRSEDPQHAQILKVSRNMRIEVLAGGDRGHADGLKEKAKFGDLFRARLTIGPGGNLYVGEQYSVRVVTPQGRVTTLAGSDSAGFVDGAGRIARFGRITGIAVTSSGNIFVTDAANQRIRKVSADGTVTTVAGSGQRGSQDGKADEASFFWPTGIAIDQTNTLYIMDMISRESWGFRVRKITADGTVSTLAVLESD